MLWFSERFDALIFLFWTVRDLVEMVGTVSPRIADIHRAVEQTEKCRARHVHSVPIIEKHEGGQDIWGGVVEVFDLDGHPKAKRAYAWQRKSEKRADAQYTVVLGIPPVNSANDAVKAAVMAAYKNL